MQLNYHTNNKSPIPKVTFYSPTKNHQFLTTKQPHQISKQKALSFNIASRKTITNNHYFILNHNQQKNSISTVLKQNEINMTKKLPNESNKQKFEIKQTDQKLYESKKSNFTDNLKVQKQNVTVVNKDYFKNKVKYFQSLRSTITNAYPAFQQRQFQQISRNASQFNKQLQINQFNRQKMFSKQQNKNKQNKFLSPSPNLAFSIVNQNNPKNNQSKQQKTPKFNHCIHSKNKQNKSNSNSSNLKNLKENTQSTFTTVNTGLIVNRQKKFPSFLSARIQKKDQNQIDKFQFKKFHKYLPLNSTLEKKNQSKTPQNKKLSNYKHAESFSVFQTIGAIKKRISNKSNQPLGKSEINSVEPLTPKKSTIMRKKANSIQIHQANFFESLHADKQKFNKTATALESQNKKCSFSLRQSLDKPSFHQKSFKKVQFQKKEDKRKNIIQKKQVNFTENPNQKTLLNINFDLKENQDIRNRQKQSTTKKCVKINQNISPQVNNIETADDIKQALINCNLFSQQDYEGVFENHKKDILKQQNSQKNTNTVKFQVESRQNKKSLKDLVDPSQDQQSRRSSQQQKKLAQMAQMCEQKRSKWILQQTDTIKQSLKQLSQYNTQKSLYDNEWKKISMKDFVTARNHRVSAQIQNIDEIKQEFYFEAKQDKQESDRFLSQTAIDQSNKDCQLNQKLRFKKVKINQKINQQVENNIIQQNKQISKQVQLNDFNIKWCSQEPIYFENVYSEQNKTFVTYWAQHKITHSLYTIKKYEKSLFVKQGESFISNFISKLKIQILLLDHQNIQKIYTVFDDKINIYILCQFTQTKLSDILSLKDHHYIIDSSDKSIALILTLKSQKEKAILFKQIIDGLEEIHLNRLVHKGLQPNSVKMVCNSCKLSGFQSCQFTQKSLNKVYNTYACPQTLFDSSKSAMDIWCLGILAYQLLIGKKPFHQQNDRNGNTVRKILECNFDIPTDKVQLCQEILNLALRRNPKDRASIFDIKNIWTTKLFNLNNQSLSERHLKKGLLQILQDKKL